MTCSTSGDLFLTRIRPFAAVIVVFIAVDAIWLLLGQHTLAAGTALELAKVILVAALFVGLAYLLRSSPRSFIFSTGIAMLLIAWPTLRIFNHLSLTVPAALADPLLAQWDAAIGFDWHAYVAFVDTMPRTVAMMRMTYTGLTAYTCLLFVTLLLTREAARACSELIGLFVISAVLCSSIGMLVPALGPMTYYAPPPGTFEHFGPATGTYSVPGIIERRSGLPQVFDFQDLPGLTTFPSFHTAMGLIAMYCSRRSPGLFGIMLVVNTCMIAGTPIFGSHYLVDLFGGAATVVFAVLMFQFSKARLATPPYTEGGQPVVGEHVPSAARTA